MHSEYYFEQAIERSLTAEGGYVKGDPKDYDKKNALIPKDVIAFVQATQPKIWERLTKLTKDNPEQQLIEDLTTALDSFGSLHVIRNGFKTVGRTCKIAYFAPNTTINETSEEQYQANIVKITRRIINEFNEKPDVVISVNGIPVITAELKNEFSATGWNVHDAVNQYQKDRKPHGRLFEFKKRTLVHFALDTCEIQMTTRLDGENTKFLPFNRGYQNGAGNPPVEDDVRTSYLWKEVLTKSSLMDILARFLHLSVERIKIRGDAGFRYIDIERMIFPRYHQLDAVRKLIRHSKSHGSGHNYLIQHSAGSGKSNTIAWLAHQLASLHNANDEKIFNSIIIITDRIVLDRQLQETVAQFEHKDGVIEKIEKDSHQLTRALAGNVPIIITTIQKFPYVMKSLKTQQKKGVNIELSTADKQFAIIVDEAHSSQSGETATELRKVLNKDGIESAIVEEFLDTDEEDESLSDNAKRHLFAEKAKRLRQPNLSFFAFTATPKWKTLAVFDEVGENGEAPFHSYTMKQAIEEGFILDVLKNYTTYDQYFKLLKIAKDNPELPKNKAKVELMRFVNLHPSVISQKVEIIIEHFRTVTMNKIGGRAKAMVVTNGRESAVRYKLAFEKYIQEKGYNDIKALVAFSGKVILNDNAEKEYTEVAMNGGIKETELPERFDSDEYQVLIVADKYQTGFDQPLLHTMFVDKKLSGIQAVQTLSRLNRTTKGKEDTFVMDFVNNHQDIYKAFKPYYEATQLGDIPDVKKLNELGTTVDSWNLYFKKDIQDFAEVWFSNRIKPTGAEHAKLNAIIDKAVDKYRSLMPEDPVQQLERQKLFKSQLQSYLNLYMFVSQIMPYADSEHEKRYVYLKALLSKLPKATLETSIDLSKVVVLEFYRLQQIGEGSINLKDDTANPLKGSTDVGTGKPNITEHTSQLIRELNEAFGTEFTITDQLFFENIEKLAIQNEKIVKAAKVNPLPAFIEFFNKQLVDMFLDLLESNKETCTKVLNNQEIKNKVGTRLAKQVYENILAEQ